MKERYPLYLNDCDGRKEPRLAGVEVYKPAALAAESRYILCSDIIDAKPEQTFFAQNVSTHWAHITSAVRHVRPEIRRVYFSTHEIRWMEEMVSKPGFQPDATYSNYLQRLDPIDAPIFNTQLVPFDGFAQHVAQITEPSLFFISHISRLTGEVVDLDALYKSVKAGNLKSILVVDGAQAIGGYKPIQVEGNCDAYIGLSSKFLGAEPNVGIAFFSDDFFSEYIGEVARYPHFDPDLYARDIYSLRQNLEHPRYRGDFMPYIRALKEYAVERIKEIDQSLVFDTQNQAPNFLTLHFGSAENNRAFVDFARDNDILVSETSNPEWMVKAHDNPVVRMGVSVRVTKDDIDILAEVIGQYTSK